MIIYFLCGMDYIYLLFRLILLGVSFSGVSLTQEPYVYYFPGSEVIRYDVPDDQHTELLPLNISFRVWAEADEGVIFYSFLEPGSEVAFEIYDGSLFNVLAFDRPDANTFVLSGAVGFGIHEDQEWLDVSYAITSNGSLFEMSQVSSQSPTPIALRLGKKVYIGGFEGEPKKLKSRNRFRGCLQDFTINGVNVFQEKWIAENPSNQDGRPPPCPLITSYMTFTGLDSYLRISNTDLTTGVLNIISFEFRTFDKEATLLMLDLGNANISVEFTNNDTLVLRMSSFGFDFNNQHPVGFPIGDGAYHRLEVVRNSTGLSVTLDNFVTYDNQMKPARGADIQAYFMAGFPGVIGFKGCLRELRVNSNRFRVRSLADENKQNVLFGKCDLIDRCYAPTRRCSHGGKCLRSRDNYECDCSGTGYGGMTCHTPLVPETCDVVTFPSNANEVTVMIDIDGAGPLRPCEVLCSKDPDTGVIKTIIQSNSSQSLTRVDGFQDPGSFVGHISYPMELPEAIGIVDRAESCQQLTEYSCTNSKLMVSPEGSTMPYGWWVDRSDRKQYYWGGATRDSRKCACSNDQGGCLGGLSCNCDAGETYQVTDQGYLANKTQLPVTQVRFGDTGTLADSKFGDYMVGNVECTGDGFLKKSVTIHRLGASINIRRRSSSMYMYAPIDISFQFKTTIGKAQLLSGEGRKDFLSIFLEDPYTLSVRMWKSDEEVYKRLTMSYKLNDDQWHTVYFERTFKESFVNVDQSETERLWLNTKWQFHNTLGLNALILGGNSNGTFGFVGCFRGVVLKSERVDLQALVEDETKGVLKGCQARCSRMSSCQNGGLCTEYYATYMCDCEKTAFTGCYCGDAIGVRFPLGSWMMFSLQDRLPSSLAYLQLYFKSTKSQGVLANVNSGGQRLVKIEINLRGGVDISFASGNGNQGLFTSKDGLTDGSPHRITVRVTLNSLSTSWDVEFDDDVQSTEAGPISHTPDRLYLASEGAGAGGFDGCIFGVMYNTVPLLKEAKMNPTPSWVSFEQNQVNLNDNDCGETETSIKNTMLTDPAAVNVGSYRLPVTITSFGLPSMMNQTNTQIVPWHFTELVCETRGVPDVSHIIRQNGGVVSCPHLLDNNRILLPPDSRVDGSYQCLATNQWGKSMSGFVSVDTPRFAEVSSVAEDSMFLREGQYLRLRCNISIDSVPEADTVWAGVDVGDNTADRFYQGVDGDLHFLWVLPEDSKVFTCYKTNPVLKNRVEVKRIRIQVNNVQDASEYTSKPLETVYSSSPQMSADIGQAVTLECLVVKHPAPNVTWSVKGSNQSLIGTSQLRGRRLVIEHFMESNAGEYQCMVDGVVMATVMLNQTFKPTWLVTTKPLTVYEGGEVDLFCIHNPLPDWAAPKTEWFINREPLQLKPSYTLNESGEGLTIRQASKLNDVFTYQCNASNQYGYAFHEAYVNVISATIVTPPSDQITKDWSGYVDFHVSVSADPGSNITFKWHHGDNETAIANDDVYRVISNQTNSRLTLDIIYGEGLPPKYGGVYRCVVTDGASEQTVSAKLTVHSKDGSDDSGRRGTGASTILQGNLALLLVTSFLGLFISSRQLYQGKQPETRLT